MGVNYFITSLIFENSSGKLEALEQDFKIDANQFADALRAKWDDVEVHYSTSSPGELYWNCQVKQFRGLDGRDGTHGVVLEKPGQYDVAAFAVWYRSVAPAQYRLSIWNDSDLPPGLELRPDTTYLQILHFFRQHEYIPTIAPLPDEHFKIDRDDFERKLKEQWPEVNIYEVHADDPYWFYWEITIQGKYGDEILQSGAIDRDQATLYLNYFHYPNSELAKFTVWYRSIIPSEYKLDIYIKAKNRSLILEENVTEQEIVDALKPSFQKGW